MMLHTLKTDCPHCGERIELVIDGSASHDYIEDCQVCCRPMTVTVVADSALTGAGEGEEKGVSVEVTGET